jgi:hypothetical protein
VLQLRYQVKQLEEREVMEDDNEYDTTEAYWEQKDDERERAEMSLAIVKKNGKYYMIGLGL